MSTEPASTHNPSPRRFQFSLSALLASVLFCYGEQMVNILWNEHNYSHPNLTPSVVFVTLSSLTTCCLILISSRHRSQRRSVITFIIAFILLVPVNLITAEVLRPRSDRNCVTAGIAACRACATAQDIYFRRNLSHQASPEYALTLEDLYEYKPGAGDLALIDRSLRNAEAFRPSATPKCGYLFKVLTTQSAYAKGGARDYLNSGRMLNGYALIAFPAVYDENGKASFIISRDGEIYQGDLGPNTTKIVKAMTTFDPDPQIWTLVE